MILQHNIYSWRLLRASWFCCFSFSTLLFRKPAEKNVDMRRFSPVKYKVGRDSLASSHAGTRLPIAHISGPDAGRSPSVRRRPRNDRHAYIVFPLRISLQRMSKNKRPAPKRLPVEDADDSVHLKLLQLLMYNQMNWFGTLHPYLQSISLSI